jgi:hypothetical protein
MQTKMSTMLDMQDRMNAKVDPQWKTTANPFLRAAAIEAGEGLESVGWKWWKKQVPDHENVKMELVDIWHFILSEAHLQWGSEAEEMLTAEYDTTLVWAFDSKATRRDITELDVRERWELLMGFAALRAPLYTIVVIFRTLLADAEMDAEELYRRYVCKNVLNFFRQDHGYKEGTYIKQWFGEEDNVWVERAAFELKIFTSEELYAHLETTYEGVFDSHTKAEELATKKVMAANEVASEIEKSLDDTEQQIQDELEDSDSMDDIGAIGDEENGSIAGSAPKSQISDAEADSGAADDSSYSLNP